MSDDDYDDRRRDKFRTERDDSRDGRGGGRGRGGYDDDFKDRRSRYDDRPRRSDHDRYGRDDREGKRRRSPDQDSYRSKRPRDDYDDHYGGGGRGRGGPPPWHGNRHHHNDHNGSYHQNQNDDDILLSFKAWVMKQDDNINEDDACKNFKLYKAEFKKKQMQEFFVTHKDEEWFRDKYHPDASDERNGQFKEAVKARFDAWNKLASIEGVFDDQILDDTKEERTIKLLENAVMLMEGASEEDVKLINSAPPPKTAEKSNADTSKSEGEGEDDDKKRDKFSRHNDDASDDEKSGKEDSKDDSKEESKEEAKKDEDEEDGEVNDPNDILEKKRNEALKRITTTYSSIFMRSLPPTISRQDISNMCKKFDGFIRVAFSHPQDERFNRRCWVTFNNNVNIKDICWNLNNIRLKDVELNPVVNRDLQRRARPMSSLSNHNVIMYQDLKYLVKIIKKYDQKFDLYEGEATNPLIDQAEKYMEDNAAPTEDKAAEEIVLNYDKTLAKLVDTLILYLRLVHSVDYYNNAEYRNEDEMPNRCGIIHVRGEPPSNPIMPFEMHDYLKKFAEKVDALIQESGSIDEDEMKSLGQKVEDAEVKKFIEVNTQQLAAEKYLCPLSGKKFKGPEFVKKHIMTKHGDKVDAVKKEVNFFNAYLSDPKRPSEMVQPVQFRAPNQSFNPKPPPRVPHVDSRRDSYTNRPISDYRDLDAPEEVDDLF